MIRATMRRSMPLVLALAAGLCCGIAAGQQGEPAMLKRATELRDAPADSGRSLASLPAQEPLTRLGEREGGWIRVRTGGGVAGWVHMFDVGPVGFGSGAVGNPAAGGNPLSSGLRGLSNMFGGGSPSPRVATSTIGLRGLEAEDLARATPNMNAVGQMERLRQGEGEARQFAADAALVAATVSALPAPARTTGGQRP